MTFDDDRDLEANEQRDKDRREATDQVEQIADSLDQDGRYIDAGVVRALISHCSDMASVIVRLRAKLGAFKKPKRQTVKTSGGKERASASGNIPRPLGIAPPHKHEYNAEGKCIKIAGGILCTATRQRQRKAKQTTIPGTDGAKTSEAGS